MADDVLTKVEKQMEGTNLALAAVAEVLQKMDARLSTDEEVQMRKEEESQAQTERTVLVKEIAGEVALLLADAGMDVDGTKVRSAAKTGKTSSGADDSEKPANIKSNIADQQATIQAMRKEEDEEEEEEDIKAAKGGYMKTHVPGHEEDEDEEPVEEGMEKEGDDEDAEKYPVLEDEDEEGDVQAMAKQLKAMKKQINTYEKSMQKAITTETESRLRKMGFREENGLLRPQQIATSPLGTDGATPIKKAANAAETVDQLADLSYKQLRDLQTKIQQGDTEGVPRELLGG